MTLVVSLSQCVQFFLYSDFDFYYSGSLNNISIMKMIKKRTNLSQYSLKHFFTLFRQEVIYFTIFEKVKFF